MRVFSDASISSSAPCWAAGAATTLVRGPRWGAVFGPFFAPLVIGAVVLAVKTALTRSFDRWLAGGLVVLAMIGAFIMRIAPTAVWESFTNFLTS